MALSEMVIGGTWGAEVDLTKVNGQPLKIDACLFSESQGRFIVEVEQEHQEKFESLMEGQPVGLVGRVLPESFLTVKLGQEILFQFTIQELARSWKGAIGW